MKKGNKSGGMLKTIVPVLVGAFISGVTSFMMISYSYSNQHRKDLLDKKFDFNRTLAKDLGIQIYLYYDFLRDLGTYNGDTIKVREALIESRKEWNSNLASYGPLLKYYYGAKVQGDFNRTVGRPLYEVRSEILFREKKHSIHLDLLDLKSKLDTVRNRSNKFIEYLYLLAESEGKKE